MKFCSRPNHLLPFFRMITGITKLNKILIKICDGCYDEVYERYNPERKPPTIQAGVFETQMETRKDQN